MYRGGWRQVKKRNGLVREIDRGLFTSLSLQRHSIMACCSGYQSFGISKINQVSKAFTRFKKCKFCRGRGCSSTNKPKGDDLSS
jgi:hypothetical protein